MSQYPPYPPQESAYHEPFYAPPPPPVRTSGMAIASLICGIVGLIACCLFVPSLLAVVFGIVAMGPTGRGEATGRGMAVAGLILGVIGLLIGGTLLIVGAISPDQNVISGAEVSAGDRATLERMRLLTADERIDLFFSAGTLSIKETGVILTDQRLIVYGSGRQDKIPLHEIVSIEFTPSEHWIDAGQFLIETETDDNLIHFNVAGQDNGDDVFFDSLRQVVTKARARAGKDPPEVSED
jgi:hypothetical protein